MNKRLAIAVLAAALCTAMAATLTSAGGGGVVFTMTNGSSKNRVVTYARAANGALTFVARTATGGRGTGSALNNQGALALNGEWLYVVNPGSDNVSAFRVNGTSLTRTDVQSSGGDRPISVAARGTLVYVLNAGGNGNIRGFRRSAAGDLTPINGSARPLSGNNTQPVQIGFARNGTRLIVTERATDRITRYGITSTGGATAPSWTVSAGDEPFGFDTASDGTLVVSEAGNHVEDGSSASSYRFNSTGSPVVVSDAVPTTETAACWTAITPNGNFAYVTNTPDHSISGFAIANNGSLTMLNANGRTAATGAGSFPIDLDTSSDGDYLYVLTAGTHRILVYAIAGSGSLASRPGVSGLSNAANGLVAR